MNPWVWAISVLGILSTAVVLGTDMFFLTVGRSALRRATESAGTEVMGFIHLYADARMPIWGVAAILCSGVLGLVSRGEQRWLYVASFVMLVAFVGVYNVLSKPINVLQTAAAKAGRSLENGRELQAAWDRSLLFRVPLLVGSVVAQCVVLMVGLR